MIVGQERLVIVVGMAHSGTTILTYVLKQHPDIVCCSEDQYLLESKWLLYQQTELIQQALQDTNKNVLLKRPWTSVWRSNWLYNNMPEARYLYCLRSFDEISKSWSKKDSLVEQELRNGSPEYQRNFYDMCLGRSMEFRSMVNHFLIVNHSDFIDNPFVMMKGIECWLNLRGFNWDVSLVSPQVNIKKVINEKT